MIGYYPQREEGELLYSTTARAAAIMYPGKSARYVARQMLGNGDLTFGGAFPNNASHLLENLMPITGLTKESIVNGSLYHLLAPFLGTEERAKLMASMFDGDSRGMRGWFHRVSTHLRYCVLCARRDDNQQKPAVWRVLPNHPAVCCCAEHGCRLTSTQAQFDLDELHDPERWIDLDVLVPGIASTEEIAVAADVQWIYEQKSAILPGFRKVTSALRRLLLETPRYRQGHGQLHGSLICRDLQDRMKIAVNSLDPLVFEQKEGSVLTTCGRPSLQRYSLLAQLIGRDLRGLLAEMMHRSNHDIQEAVIIPVKHTPETLEQARTKIKEVVSQNPNAKRSEIIGFCGYQAATVRRLDRNAYEQLLPGRRRRGRCSFFDWKSRDQALHNKILTIKDSLGSDARSFRRILSRAGLSTALFEKAKKRLPETYVLVLSLKRTWWANHRRIDLAGAA